MRVRRLRMVVALDRVGHGLSDAMPGLEAAQKTSPVIGYPAAYNPDQFRVYWLGRQNGLAVPYVPGMRSEANHMRMLTDGA